MPVPVPDRNPVPMLRPISDLRTHLNDIEAEVRESGEPLVLTRNGRPSLVVMDSDAYNAQLAQERQIRLLREAEIEAKYHDETVSLEDSKSRLASLMRQVEALDA